MVHRDIKIWRWWVPIHAFPKRQNACDIQMTTQITIIKSTRQSSDIKEKCHLDMNHMLKRDVTGKILYRYSEY